MACRTIELFDQSVVSQPLRRWNCDALPKMALSIQCDDASVWRKSARRRHREIGVAQRGNSHSRSVERIVFSFATMVALAAAVIFGAQTLIFAPSQAPMRTTAVVIAPGESLWSVAQQYSAPGQSTAQMLAEICAVNSGLDHGGSVRVGERIIVPLTR
jgi:hypothetical protein